MEPKHLGVLRDENIIITRTNQSKKRWGYWEQNTDVRVQITDETNILKTSTSGQAWREVKICIQLRDSIYI